ncbi:MAG TPA: tetratricopeptide repeat protein, partial [Candidatus Binatia bacterium]|nr:tetratricopeptide repeat protein [Candidatus Binatia bacterium]
GQRSWTNLTLAASLVVLTFLVYLPAMGGGFVWDDDSMLTDNIVLKERGLYRSWFTTEQPNYWPLTWTSYWLEYQLWGFNPIGYHVGNVLLHAASALLVWRILVQLNIPGAWVAAAVFAVHPVNVESVAWITQRKNTLSLFFFLLSLLCYLRFDYRGIAGLYWTAIASFVLAMLSKGTVVALPVVLLMCAWWLRGTIGRPDVLRSIPFFAVSAVMSVVEIWFQYVRAIGEEVVRNDAFFGRLAGAGWVVWFYLYKALLPIDLSFIYPRWRIDPTNWLSYIPDLALLAVLGLCWRFRRSWGRAPLFALGYFVVTLTPVLGFFDFYFMKYSFVADHYQYVSIIGIIALVVSAGRAVLKRVGRSYERFAYLGSAVVLVALGLLTWRQGQIYKDHETLWRETLRRNPNASLAHNNLGFILALQGKTDEGISHYRQAIKLEPDHDKAHSNLASALVSQGRLEEAVKHYRQALRINPRHAGVHNNLGIVLVSQGNLDEAISHLRQAVKLKPDHARAHYNLGGVLAEQGQLDTAIDHFRHALRIDADRAHVHESLGRALARLGKSDEAIIHYNEALRIMKSGKDEESERGSPNADAGKVK